MKPNDLSVYDFKEEDELTETCHHWSKLSNPKLDADNVSMIKYNFLQHASSGSINQMNEIHNVQQVHVVAIDDDDRGFANDISGGTQDILEKAASEQAEVCSDIPDRILQQRRHFSRDNLEPKSSLLNMEIRISCPFGLPPVNGHISPCNTESPFSNHSVDAGASDGRDSIQESSPSTSGSEQEENYVPMYGQAEDHSDSGWNVEDMNTVHADYVSYGGRYFPACLISFFKTSLKFDTSALEEESGAFRSEWKLDDIFSIESQWSSSANTAKVKICFLTKDAVPAENVHGVKGIEVLEFMVHDPIWLQKQDWIWSLDKRYQAVWSIGLNSKICEGGLHSRENGESSSDTYIPNFEEPFKEVVYPKDAVDAVSISKRDVDLLEPDTFLNDTIIDFYIKFLENEIPASERSRFHFFNCFFFRKLADPDKNSSGVFDGKAAFQRVRKWTRKVNIFEKDYLFIPVNYNLHWSLIVICHPGEVANFNDENVDQSVKLPCILHMDSIRGSHAGLKDLIQSYLLEEWKVKQMETSEDIVSKFLNLRFLSLELPQQENCSDCGLFLLHYAELFIAEAPENFNPFQINKFDTFLKPDWFMPAEASLKRVHIQRLIYELLEGRTLENASSCNHESQSSALPETKENNNGVEIITERRSPRKSWNSLHSQAVQEMDMGLLDMSLYRNPDCTNISGLGMKELLEQCQHFDQGAPFERSGCPMPSIREEVGAVDHLAPSTLGQSELQPIDGIVAEAFDIGHKPANAKQGFHWNSSNLGDREGNSSLSPNCSSDDSDEMMIIECEQEVQGFASGQNKNSDQQKENIDSLTESFASASSDMMETPAEDSQELAKIYGNNDLEDSHAPNQEEASPAEDSQELAKIYGTNDLEDSDTPNQEEAKEPCHQELEKIDDDGDTAVINEMVEDSSSDSDEGHNPKRIRLTPSGDGSRELVRSLSKELQV